MPWCSMKIKVVFVRRIWPKDENISDKCIFSYRIIEKTEMLSCETITCVGYCLPTSSASFEFTGELGKSKFGTEFRVESFEEIIKPGRQNIVGYLMSGQIKGIGPKTAEAIYDMFGDDTLNILDDNIERLREVPGIGAKKILKITDSYLQNRNARDIIAFLLPYGVTPRKATLFFKEFGKDTMKTVTEHPYSLCKIKGIGFKISDKIAMNTGIDPLSAERIRQCVLFVLKDAQSNGHMCLSLENIVSDVVKCLNTPEITTDMVVFAVNELWEENNLVLYNGKYFLPENAYAEEKLAEGILKKVAETSRLNCINLDAEIDFEERENLGFRLASEQRQAVIAALTSSITIVTGGPGTGKSAIQKAMLDIFEYQYPMAKILCCAPTGKAASRMTQASGRPASTIHKALGIMCSEDGECKARKKIDADFVIVDEISMMDEFLAAQLFSSLKSGCHLVLVGDADQLPSVGAGCVLHDMIDSGAVPMVKLATVYRQKDGSIIAVNAARMNQGESKLEYGDDFQFVDSKDLTESQAKIIDIYRNSVAEYGVDQVCLLSPLKTRSETCVNVLNPLLREVVNPACKERKEVAFGLKTFREGDKIIQTKNFEGISNGDVGYISKIFKDEEGDTIVACVFGDDHINYEVHQLDMIDLAYGLSIHKSQGSEYNVCIISLQMAQYIMLNRPLIYTAITRAKKKVIIVGEKRALHLAIKTEELNRRCTCLVDRLGGRKTAGKISLFVE